MSLGSRQRRFTECVGKLIFYAYAIGYELSFGDTYPGKYKHRSNSYHNLGLAIDLNLFKDGKYLTNTEDHAELGKFWLSLDPLCSWGGHWGDGNHYSYGEGK